MNQHNLRAANDIGYMHGNYASIVAIVAYKLSFRCTAVSHLSCCCTRLSQGDVDGMLLNARCCCCIEAVRADSGAVNANAETEHRLLLQQRATPAVNAATTRRIILECSKRNF